MRIAHVFKAFVAVIAVLVIVATLGVGLATASPVAGTSYQIKISHLGPYTVSVDCLDGQTAHVDTDLSRRLGKNLIITCQRPAVDARDASYNRQE